jgi:hypothetical protein
VDREKSLKEYEMTVVKKEQTAYENRLKQIISEARAKGTTTAHKMLEPLGYGLDSTKKIVGSGSSSSTTKNHSRS